MRIHNMRDYNKTREEVDRRMASLAERMGAGEPFSGIIKRTKAGRLRNAAITLLTIAAVGTSTYFGIDYLRGRTDTPIAYRMEENAGKPQITTPQHRANETEIRDSRQIDLALPGSLQGARSELIKQQVNQYLGRWKTAWEQNRGYREMYSPYFKSERGESLEAYLARKDGYKRERGDSIRISLSDIGEPVLRDDACCISFSQRYASSKYSDYGTKELCIAVKDGELTKIVSENWQRR
jgi:hypothetical protein